MTRLKDKDVLSQVFPCHSTLGGFNVGKIYKRKSVRYNEIKTGRINHVQLDKKNIPKFHSNEVY